MQSILRPGEEVILIEPFFDIYKMQLEMCRAKVVSVPLRPPSQKPTDADNLTADSWTLDMQELESKITPKTKLLLLNTPHNPTGKVFSLVELQKIAEVCIRRNILVLSDEVYEELVFNDKKHTRICTLPGMWERTMTVSSAGKLFGATGWRVGWVYGPTEAIANCVKVQSMTVFTSVTPLQVRGYLL